jgi:hypothetical protein
MSIEKLSSSRSEFQFNVLIARGSAAARASTLDKKRPNSEIEKLYSSKDPKF